MDGFSCYPELFEAVTHTGHKTRPTLMKLHESKFAFDLVRFVSAYAQFLPKKMVKAPRTMSSPHQNCIDEPEANDRQENTEGKFQSPTRQAVGQADP